jgi:hypothetical protein
MTILRRIGCYFSGTSKALVLSFGIAVLASALFMLLNAAFVFHDPAPRRAKIASAVNGGLLEEEGVASLLNRFKTKLWHQNECMILYMLMGERESFLRDAISPLVRTDQRLVMILNPCQRGNPSRMDTTIATCMGIEWQLLPCSRWCPLQV